MNATIEQRKEQAIKALEKLDIYKPYIRGFKESNKVCFFENFGGFWVHQEPEIEAKMKEIEEKYGCTVYAITHEFTEFGECWDFLIVSNEVYEWESLVDEYAPKKYYAFAYVWNKDDDWCSEFGDIAVQSFGGGIRRIS